MKTIRYEFKGYGVWPSTCYIHLVQKDNTNYILFEDINEGTSVTNVSEQLAEAALDLFGLHHSECRFFETYSKDLETFDEITYEWSEHEGRDHRDLSYRSICAKHPKWKPSNEETKHLFHEILHK